MGITEILLFVLLVLALAGDVLLAVLLRRSGKKTADAPTAQDYVDAMTPVLQGETDLLFDIEDLLSVDNARPWQILAITFTNKAANELK